MNFLSLSNDQAAGLLTRLDRGRLLVGHLSEKNNRPKLVRERLLQAAPELTPHLTLAGQDRGSGWLAL